MGILPTPVCRAEVWSQGRKAECWAEELAEVVEVVRNVFESSTVQANVSGCSRMGLLCRMPFSDHLCREQLE
jgi:hypothetical protein